MTLEHEQDRTGARVATGILLVCSGALVMLGMVMYFSAGMTLAGRAYPVVPLLYFGAGFGALGLVALSDYRWLTKLSSVLYVLALAGLVAVLIWGPVHRGAQRWIEVFGVRFQPSEFAKLALVISLAHYGHRYRRQMRSFRRGFVVPSVLTGAVLFLIFREPDWGSTVLLATVSGVMLLVAGVRWWYMSTAIGVALGLFLVLLAHNDHRRGRVEAYLKPSLAPPDVTLQNFQAIKGLERGGVSGVGLGNSMQKYANLPDHQTDFILAIVGEELGLVGSLGVLGAFLTLALCGVNVAWRARDPFGTLLATGLTFLIGLQAFVNIGVVTWLLPNKGLPLPFISRGGSNLVVMLIAVGLLISVSRHSVAARRTSPTFREWEEVPAPQST